MEIQQSTPLSKPTILLISSDTRTILAQQWEKVQQKFNILIYDCNSVEEFCKRLSPGGVYSKIDAIVRTGWLKAEPYSTHLLFTTAVAKHYPSSLKLIVCSGHGYDAADVDTLTEMGIWYCNTPDTCTEAVANTALYLILSAYRYFTFAERCARNDWALSRSLGMKAVDPLGTTLGIVGLGDIGARIARKAALGLGMKLCYYNRKRDVERERQVGVEISYCPSLAELLETSDCVVLACPYTPATHHMLSTKEFELAKEGGMRVVNIARGRLIDEAALLQALRDQKVVGVGLDVHENEPGINDEWAGNYMATVLPHIGVCSRTSWDGFEKVCWDNAEAFFETGKPLTPVNSIA
ncbi:putative 2-hydroxyacid dehydrogenase [Lachnellula hyalina]|uniref:Putative 2-hydroxyacid dehydrogenase n=1 Tax=Lachnellula hyalina TaxID=1316788 RepID=A0A8H8R986_9HELO|nr:putative 2-hydroxyacid dehydrogenase [Lachnellula hyalina]TVY30756.1 putative 2-hydroxyacid dehydrogenase [Lachnellula hyalina]